jgi:ketosteroid isomerase-like protein
MSDDRNAILAVEDQRIRALVDLDMATLDILFAEDLVHIHSSGLVHDKQGILAHIERNRAFRNVERGALKLRQYGDVALLSGPIINHMESNGQPFTLTGIVTQALRKEQGRWRFIHFQFTLTPQATA